MGFAGGVADIPAAEPAARFRRLRDEYFRAAMSRNPTTSTFLGADGRDPGLAEANGRLRDYRPSALAEEAAAFDRLERELSDLETGSLDEADAIDLELMRAQLAFMRRQFAVARHHERCVDTYVSEPFRAVDWQLRSMIGAGAYGAAGWELLVARLRAIGPYLAVATENLRRGLASGNPSDRRMIEIDGIAGSRSSAEYFKSQVPATVRRTAGRRRDHVTSVVVEAASGAADAYERFAAFLATFPVDQLGDRFAVGEADYRWRLRNNLRDDRSVDELWDAAGAAIAETRERLFGLTGELGRRHRLGLRFRTAAERAAAVRTVKQMLGRDAPRDNEERLRWFVDANRRAIEYGRALALFEIPADYVLPVEPTPPLLRSTVEAAFYPTSPLRGTGVGSFYVTPVDEDPAALSLNNRSTIAHVAVHEGFPGHDWHYRQMATLAGRIPSVRWFTPGAVEDSASMWCDSMSLEGWGLYAEGLLAEPVPGARQGFYTPGERFYGILNGELQREVRVLLDVGLHTGRLTFDEAVAYQCSTLAFMPDACERAGSDPTAKLVCSAARRNSYRYSKWPTQAITYSLGRTAIRMAREAWRRNGLGTLRSFHEDVMRLGPIPVTYAAVAR